MKTALWLLLIEVAVLLVMGAAATVVVQWRRIRRDRAAVARLVATVRAQMPERRAGARDLLGRTGMLGQVLDEATDRIAQGELRLYEVYANAYLDRDAGAVVRLNEVVDAAIAPYRALGVAAPADTDIVVANAHPEAPPGVDPAEYERLKDENQRLSAELQVTLDTMSRMLSEYSAMFAGGADAALDKEKLREMFQAENSPQEQAPSEASTQATIDAKSAAGGGAAALPPLFDLGEEVSGLDPREEDPELVALDAIEADSDQVNLDAPPRGLDLGPVDARDADPDLVELPADREKALAQR